MPHEGNPANLVEAITSSILLMAALVLYLRRFASPRRWLAISLLTCLLDQASKGVVLQYFRIGWHHSGNFKLLSGRLSIGMVENPSLGFGKPSSALLVFTILLAFALLILYLRLRRHSYRMPLLTEVGCAILLGGISGILLDRIRLGYVIDFIDFGEKGNFTYNLADFAVFAAAILLAIRAIQFLVQLKVQHSSLRRAISSRDTIKVAAVSCEMKEASCPQNRKWHRHLRYVWTPAMLVITMLILAFFWKMGADEYWQLPPLHKAVAKCDSETVRRLLADGADANGKDKDGETPLFLAAMLGNADVCKTLIAGGANVNLALSKSMTPLSASVIHGHRKVAEILLEHGAKLPEGILSQAARSGDSDLVKLFLAHGVDVNQSSYGGRTPLLWSVDYRNPTIIKLLLTSGANANAKNIDGKTALHKAAAYGEVETAKVLLAAGADVNAKDNWGETPLHSLDGLAIKIRGGSGKAIAALLLAHGAEVNAKAKDGRTPLVHAARKRDGELVKLLFDSGADVNIRDAKGWTALHYAVAKDDKEIARLLLSAKASASIKNDKGETPVQLAKSAEIKKMLGEYERADQQELKGF